MVNLPPPIWSLIYVLACAAVSWAIGWPKLVDMELSIPDGLIKEAAKRSKFEAGSIELTLRGLCPECRG